MMLSSNMLESIIVGSIGIFIGSLSFSKLLKIEQVNFILRHNAWAWVLKNVLNF